MLPQRLLSHNQLSSYLSMSLFIPKSFSTLRSGYTKATALKDLTAGITVGIISLPLAMAFAMGAGLDPERGLFTAIVAGFLISLLGGSKYQIGGPTGAFVVLIYDIVVRHGYAGLVTATIMAGLMLIAFGVLRCGVLIRFIPHSVILGFTAGLAVIIMINQVKDFFGLSLAQPSADALGRLKQYAEVFSTLQWPSFFAGVATLALLFFFKKKLKRFPAPVLALGCVTLFCTLFNCPIETIKSRFGEIPHSLPPFSAPDLSFYTIRTVFPDALAIALLGAIESLLSCLIADGLTGTRHRSNCELIAQGIGNIASALFGGIPATGALARTSANVQLGAQTPIAGMTHAVTLFILMALFAPFASLMPLPALAAILAFVAWNMLELKHILELMRTSLTDGLILFITAAITIAVDITAAVQTGVLLSVILFLKKMRESSTGRILDNTLANTLESIEQQEFPESTLVVPPAGVAIFDLEGPFFFAISDLLNELMEQVATTPHVVIIRFRAVPFIDSSGLTAIARFIQHWKKKNVTVLLVEARAEVAQALMKLQLPASTLERPYEGSLSQGIEYSKSLVAKISIAPSTDIATLGATS